MVVAQGERKSVVALLGSRRKGNTYSLVKELQILLEPHGIDVSVHNLHDYHVDQCSGCHRCILGKKCGIKDVERSLEQTLVQADALILAAPVYMDHIPGTLKNFVDRTCRWYHRPELVGKPLLSVCTTAHSGLRQTLGYMETVGVKWAMYPAGRIARTTHDMEEPLLPEEYSQFVRAVWMPLSEHRPSLKQLIDFQVKRVLAALVLEHDREFWEERGWLDQSYYYPCAINPAKLALAEGFYKFLSSRVQKTLDRQQAAGTRRESLRTRKLYQRMQREARRVVGATPTDWFGTSMVPPPAPGRADNHQVVDIGRPHKVKVG